MNYQFISPCHVHSLIKALFLVYTFYVVLGVKFKRIIGRIIRVVGSGATKNVLRGGLIVGFN